MSTSPYYSMFSFTWMAPVAVIYSLASQMVLFGLKGILLAETPKRLTWPLRADAIPNTDGKEERVAIVTGSNTGIGFETAKSLALEYGFTVILACRSRDKALAAVAAIEQSRSLEFSRITSLEAGTIQRTPGRATFLVPLDLSSKQSIGEFCKAVKDKYKAIHVLVNNAGLNTGKGEPSQDNLDLLFQSNFLGHFLLTQLLLPNLSPKARVVNLSSVMHHFCNIPQRRLDDTTFWRDQVARHDQPPYDTYPLSKLAAVLFSIELNRRYSDRLEAIAVNPGGVNSDIWRGFPRLVIPLFKLFFLDNRQGSQTSSAAAVGQFPRHLLSSSNPTLYLQPYRMPFGNQQKSAVTVPFPVFEMLGPFWGYVITQPRLPLEDGGIAAAEALWNASAQLMGTVTSEPSLPADR